MTDYLDDIASDLSAFHRIGNAGEMEAAVFFRLVLRLPAYEGVLRAALGRQAQDASPGAQPARVPAAYESGSGYHNNALAASTAPPATASTLSALNARLGGGWFDHKVVTDG